MTITESIKVESPPTRPATKQAPQQIVNAGIERVIEAHGIEAQKNRYKAMRAIAWQAFTDAIDAGTFEALVTRASANVRSLPPGWKIERPAKVELVPTTPARKTAAR